jgi:hypothetical protein
MERSMKFMEQSPQKIIRFEDIKQDILNALEDRIASEKIDIKGTVSLFDGFISQPFSTKLSNSFIIGGPTIPMIMLVGDESGQIYFIALKALNIVYKGAKL